MCWITFCCLHSVEYKNSSKAQTCHSGSGFCKHIEIRGQHKLIRSENQNFSKINEKPDYQEIFWIIVVCSMFHIFRGLTQIFRCLLQNLKKSWDWISGNLWRDCNWWRALLIRQVFISYSTIAHLTYYISSAISFSGTGTGHKSSIIYLMKLLDKG